MDCNHYEIKDFQGGFMIKGTFTAISVLVLLCQFVAQGYAGTLKKAKGIDHARHPGAPSAMEAETASFDTALKGYQLGVKEGMESFYRERTDIFSEITVEDIADYPTELPALRRSQAKQSGGSRIPSGEFSRAYDRGFEDGLNKACKELYFGRQGTLLSPAGHYELALVYLSKSNYDSAFNHLYFIIRSFPESDFWQLALLKAASINSNRKMHFRAACCFYRYMTRFPDDVVKCEVLLNLSRELMKLSFEGPATYFDMILKCSSELARTSVKKEQIAEAFLYSGMCHEFRKNFKEAEEAYGRVIRNYKYTDSYKVALRRRKNMKSTIK